MNKIAIIGMGYWGQIIHKNLLDMGHTDIVTYDEYKPSAVQSLDEIKAEYVFVCVSSSEHYRICKHFLSRGETKVFCEKPLTGSLVQSKELFDLAVKTNSYLFVDWLFLYNSEVRYIKHMFQYDINIIKNINMNRLNKGPERTDTNAIFDLASHDVSILNYLFGGKPNDVHWISYKRNPKSIQDDSCVGLLKYKETTVQVNCSWEHNLKDRTCIFGFDDGILVWNDINKEILINNKKVPINKFEDSSPIYNVISAFMNGHSTQETLRNRTLDIEEVLNATCLNIR